MQFFKICLSIIFSSCAVLQCAAQQLPERSTYDSNAFIWNPAMTSVHDYWEFGANYKQQWAGFDDAPRTITASFQYPFSDKNMSFGAYLMHDRTHPLVFSAIGFTYNYQLKLNITSDDYLSIGILGTYGEHRVDTKNVITSDGRDPLTPLDGASRITPNAGVGLFYATAKDKFYQNTYYIGVAANQLFSSDLIFDGVSQEVNLTRVPHANAILGASFLLNADTYLEPSLWVNYASENIYDFNAGIRIEQEDIFWAGANYTTAQAFSVQGGIILTDGAFQDGQLRIGGLANYNLGKLGSSLGIGYEFYIAYRFYN